MRYYKPMTQKKHRQVEHLVTFVIDEQTFGLPLKVVTRVEQAVEITKVPGAPPYLMGVINHRGQILPVINLRYKFGLPCRALETNDQLLIVNSRSTTIVLPVDRVEGVVALKNLATSEQLTGVGTTMRGVMADNHSLTMVAKPEQLLTANEKIQLQQLDGLEYIIKSLSVQPAP